MYSVYVICKYVYAYSTYIGVYDIHSLYCTPLPPIRGRESHGGGGILSLGPAPPPQIKVWGLYSLKAALKWCAAPAC